MDPFYLQNSLGRLMIASLLYSCTVSQFAIYSVADMLWRNIMFDTRQESCGMSQAVTRICQTRNGALVWDHTLDIFVHSLALSTCDTGGGESGLYHFLYTCSRDNRSENTAFRRLDL